MGKRKASNGQEDRLRVEVVLDRLIELPSDELADWLFGPELAESFRAEARRYDERSKSRQTKGRDS